MTYNLQQHPHIKDIIAMILTAIIGGLMIFCCSSCSTSKTVEKSYTDVSRDSTYHHSADSVLVSTSDNSTDSLVQNTVVYVTLDSLGNETKRVEYHDTYHSRLRDSGSSKVVIKTDTLFQTKYRIVNRTEYKTVVKEATFSFIQKFFINFGKIALVVFIIGAAVYLYRKRDLLHILLKS